MRDMERQEENEADEVPVTDRNQSGVESRAESSRSGGGEVENTS